MLHLRQTLRRAHDLPQTLLIKLVGKGSRRSAPEDATHRYHMILFRHILVNRIVGEASQRKPSAREKHFDFVRGRELPDAIENVGGFFLSEHVAIGTYLAIRRSASIFWSNDVSIFPTSVSFLASSRAKCSQTISVTNITCS